MSDGDYFSERLFDCPCGVELVQVMEFDPEGPGPGAWRPEVRHPETGQLVVCCPGCGRIVEAPDAAAQEVAA